MADSHTKKQRSYNMSRIRSSWTAPELLIHNLLKGNKVKHKMHPKIAGSPDLILKDSKTAVFIHGCFWHKCPKCYIEPKTKRSYWLPKIEKNVRRDRDNIKTLEDNGWKVIKIWEHEIRNDTSTLKRILRK